MNPPSLHQIEKMVSCLSDEEQLCLMERMIHNLRLSRRHNHRDSHEQTLEQQLVMMANDPGIQGELKAIDQEFAVTEMDGLTELWVFNAAKFILLISTQSKRENKPENVI